MEEKIFNFHSKQNFKISLCKTPLNPAYGRGGDEEEEEEVNQLKLWGIGSTWKQLPTIKAALLYINVCMKAKFKL